MPMIVMLIPAIESQFFLENFLIFFETRPHFKEYHLKFKDCHFALGWSLSGNWALICSCHLLSLEFD